jgi:quaternary ammonium compound-resistance protein SugE
MLAVLIVLAALAFTVGGYFMKLSSGLTRVGPSLLMFALFAIGAACQALAMRNEPMGTTYVTVLGLEAVTAYLLGVVFLHEGSSPVKLVGVALVVGGIVLLKLSKL